MDEFVISVFELNTYVSDKLSQDSFLEEIWVKGEICDFDVKHNIAYFVLSDDQASVDCMLFDYSESIYAELLVEGQTVLLSGDISVYRKNGKFRVVVQKAQVLGAGELYARFNLLKERLEKQGIFSLEHKRCIPKYPKKIGIVTSKQGAALQDIINIARRRNSTIQLVLYPAKVQGAEAPEEIVRGIQYLNEHTDVDVLLVGRGGGSAEDLFAFNDERVVMAIYGSGVPIISAVGHESDYTLSDMAADLRAPTPSAAAELAIAVREDVAYTVATLKTEIKSAVQRLLYSRKLEFENCAQKVSKLAIRSKLTEAGNQIRFFRQQAKMDVNLLYQNLFLRYNTGKVTLEGNNPTGVLKRGYSIALKNGRTVKSIEDVVSGDALEILLADGRVLVNVTEKIQKGQ